MTEWQVVLVIIALFGFIAAVVTPIVKLNTNITRLTSAVERLQEKLDESNVSNTTDHRRLWAKNDEQDEKLTDHEMRIHDLEGQK